MGIVGGTCLSAVSKRRSIDFSSQILLRILTVVCHYCMLFNHLSFRRPFVYGACDYGADYTACNMNGYWNDNVVHPFVVLCIVAKRYILQQKCQNI